MIAINRACNFVNFKDVILDRDKKLWIKIISNKNNAIRELLPNKLDQELMIILLAGVSDLMASETKYHLACFSACKRSSEKAKQDTNDTDLAFVWHCQELEYVAHKGHTCYQTE